MTVAVACTSNCVEFVVGVPLVDSEVLVPDWPKKEVQSLPPSGMPDHCANLAASTTLKEE